ncbi:MAG: transcription-repair coupling factor [bacterium]|nr:transcription-repair coupling factor [bacterium]
MQLTGLLQLLREDRRYLDFVERLRKGQTQAYNATILRAARPFLAAALAQDWDGPVLFLTSQSKRAHNVTGQLPVWLDGSDATRPILRFSEPTPHFYERVPWSTEAIRGRLETLAALMPPGDTSPEAKHQPVIIASARALMQRTLPVHQFRRGSMLLKAGQRHNLEKLLASWVALGYESTPIVIEPGTFSRRGGVIDIFPIAAERPTRLEFFDDEIDTLKLFDVSTQRTDREVKQVGITPAREALPTNGTQVAADLAEWFSNLTPAEDDMTGPAVDLEPLKAGNTFPYLEHYLPYMVPNPVSLLDYAPPGTLIVLEDRDDLRAVMEEIATAAIRTRQEQLSAGQISPDHPQPYLDWEMLESAFSNFTVVELSLHSEGALSSLFSPGERFGGQLRPMLTRLRDRRGREGRVVVVTGQAGRLTEIWYEQDSSAYIPTVNDLPQPPGEGTLVFVNGTLQEGWTLNTGSGADGGADGGASARKTHLITDAEIFGWNRPEPRRRKAAKRARLPESEYADWKPGDIVVHVDYGIGQFVGMQHRTVEGNEREYLVIQYEGTDTLFVPIHQADRLTRYIGADDTPPHLNKLGQPDWGRTRSRASKAVEEEAKGLLELYAQRASTQGYAFQPDTHWQHELEASFPFVETEDQLKAVRAVKADMEAAHPMDRLICGDVGYGKTEVALRAAFKAVMDHKQVAILVPTTVLAQQHYETFKNRLASFPVVVEVMSRFRTKEDLDKILPRLAEGEIDIIIGTHRILSDDVRMKDLGLMIIDEEQRFGVKQKEHFKRLRTQVDVLTLTATPIPRTLYMSLTGVRDISMIQTPPEERLPVITHVGEFDEGLLRQAIMRELERDGQVFFVHNRIRTIDHLRDKLEETVPEARVATGHGQMNERQLEPIMTAFAHGEYDVLLSTAIIESGIDIPNANTLIVDRADMFGLAQLYQLRGRVGRSAQQAYAYFFHSGNRRLTEEARARLDTLAENSHLGAGFQIAMRDLELRGAGDILSTRQTGQVAAVGLHLYTQMLTQAIRKLRGETDQTPLPVASTTGIVIDLPIPAYIPADWIPEMALRLQIYRRIGGLSTQQDVNVMRDELRDRFGQLPIAVDGLLYQIEVKVLAQAANATHVMARDGSIQIRLPYLAEVNRPSLEQQLGYEVEVSRTAVTLPLNDLWQIRLIDVLGELAQGVRAGMMMGGGL